MSQVDTPQADNGYTTFDRLTMYTANPKGSQHQRPRMSFGIDPKGSPIISVSLNDPELQGRMNFINAVYQPKEFMNVVATMYAVLNNPEPNRLSYVTYRSVRDPEGKPTNDKVVLVTLHICKDKEGLVWLALDQEGKPKVKFIFEIAEWHTILDKDGTTVTPAFMSQIVAKATFDALLEMGTPAVLNKAGRVQRQQRMVELGATKTPAPTGIEEQDITF